MKDRDTNQGKLMLITGGASSGKSEYAESLAVSMNTEPKAQTLWYLATMHPDPKDPETVRRIEKHRKAREGKGFRTVEQERDLIMITDRFRKGDIILMEDLPNLLANEMFSPALAEDPEGMSILQSGAALNAFLERKILHPLSQWKENGIRILAVGSRISEDLPAGEESVAAYSDGLMFLQRELGKMASAVTEVVCGIPLCCK